MPKKAPVFETQEGEHLHNLMQELLKNQKPKQKRVITDERREQLKEQLLKGREKSLATRAKQKEDNAIKKKLLKEKKNAPEQPVQPVQKDDNDMSAKFDNLLAQMKELTGLQKETLDHKKNSKAEKAMKEKTQDMPKEEPKRTKKDRSKDEEEESEVEEWVLAKPPKKAPKDSATVPKTPSKSVPPTPKTPSKPVPSFYYVPTKKKKLE